jgi:hypothetical protein
MLSFPEVRMQPDLTPGETAYLMMAIGAFALFAVTLFACQLDFWRTTRRRIDTSHRLAAALPQPAE